MKAILVCGLLILSGSAWAAKEPPSKACLKKVVRAVNKHHKLAEGAVYALRQIYNGESASVLLVGHSDETDPTDYLVTVEKKDCRVKAIVYTNDASGVEEYTPAEGVDRIR